MNQPQGISEKEICSSFKMPKRVRRSSTITNSLVQAIIPRVRPSAAEVLQVLEILGMTPANICCAYCGGPYSEWDHINPIVNKKQPTGYWSTIRNLVPACSKCNQSKGGQDWKKWMTGSASQSPASRGITDLWQRKERLESYDLWSGVRPRDFEALVGDELLQEYQRAEKTVQDAMRDAQAVAERVQKKLASALGAELDEAPVTCSG